MTGFIPGLVHRLPQIQRECGKFTPELLRPGNATANLPLTGAVKVEVHPPMTTLGQVHLCLFCFLLLRISLQSSRGQPLSKYYYGVTWNGSIHMEEDLRSN